MNQSYQIELSIQCRNLKDKDTFSKSDPQVLVYLKQFKNDRIDDRWSLIGKTEQIKDCLNPNFKKTFVIDFMFEIKQPIRFEVRDIDGNDFDDLGSAESTIGNLFGARNQTSILDLSKGGKLIAYVDRIQVSNIQVTMKWSARDVPGGLCSKPNTSLRFYKVKQAEVFSYETEVAGSTSNPSFKQFQLMQSQLTDPFRVVVANMQKIVGSTMVTFQDLRSGRKLYPIQGTTAVLNLDFYKEEERPSFMDYLRGGMQINLSLAMDFTGSNGHPLDPQSLHALNGHNQYLTALISVGEILLAYDYDKQVPCYGFGAVLRYPNLKTMETMHCFPMSGDQNNTNAVGLEGFDAIYKYALNNVDFSGPTLFAPIIRETMKLAKEIKLKEQPIYLVFLILTDGAINDFSETCDLIEQCQYLPMSIIIIGVGNADFDLMEKLDGDDKLLPYCSKRDIVQFVPFRKFNTPFLLAKEVLAELPDQLVNYMTMQGVKPLKPQEHLVVD